MIQYVAIGMALLAAGCYTAGKKEEDAVSPASDTSDETVTPPVTQDTADDTAVDTDTDPVSLAPLNGVPFDVKGQVMGVFSCVDEYLNDAVCYVSQFPGNVEVTPRAEVHRITGNLALGSSGLVDTKLTDFDYTPGEANVNAPVSVILNGKSLMAIPYNAVTHAPDKTNDSLDSFGGIQEYAYNGVAFYDNLGDLVGDLDLASISHEDRPLSGPVTPLVVGGRGFVGASNYGQEGADYIGNWGMSYGPSVLVEFDETLSADTAIAHPLKDAAGNPYYELRSVISDASGQHLLLTACNSSQDAVLLEYNLETQSLREISTLALGGAGFIATQDEYGNITWSGDPAGYVELTSAGDLIETTIGGINTSFVSGATRFGSTDGSHLVSLQEELNSTTVAPYILWIGPDGMPQILADDPDNAAQTVLPHIELAAGAFGISQRIAVGGFSGSDRTSDRLNPWDSRLHFLY